MNKRLKKAFDHYNEKYWDGSLMEIDVGFSSCLIEACGQYFFPTSQDDDHHHNYSIKICTSLSTREEINNTLLHEMCHHAMFLNNKHKYWKRKLSWHGTYWKKEMIRVGFKPPITSRT